MLSVSDDVGSQWALWASWVPTRKVEGKRAEIALEWRERESGCEEVPLMCGIVEVENFYRRLGQWRLQNFFCQW